MSVASGPHSCPAAVKGLYSGDPVTGIYVGSISSVDLVLGAI